MGAVLDEFKDIFSFDNLKIIYEKDVARSNSTGVDNVNSDVFQRDLDENIALIERKVLEGSYRFTRYKQKLLSKGAHSSPREVCIPTIRDRVVLKALNQFLQKRLVTRVKQPIPQNITKDVKEELGSGKFDWILKLDISSFYPSIKHNVLRKRLRKFVKDELILNLIDRAISRGTGKGGREVKGVPQGLPISNILSAIYLRNLDKRYQNMESVFYRRYVDDILILCDSRYVSHLKHSVSSYCKEIGLKVYDPEIDSAKSTSCCVADEFSYLGYVYNPVSRPGCLATTRNASKQKIINSLTGIFTSYQKSRERSEARLQWRINLRITGCISDNKGKGWVFFFSEIDDEMLLHELDSIVDNLCRRFSVSFKKKRFVRAWYEINHNRWRNNYFPNFDNYNVRDMTEVVATFKGKEAKDIDMEEKELRVLFWKILQREIRDMEADVQGFS